MAWGQAVSGGLLAVVVGVVLRVLMRDFVGAYEDESFGRTRWEQRGPWPALLTGVFSGLQPVDLGRSNKRALALGIFYGQAKSPGLKPIPSKAE